MRHLLVLATGIALAGATAPPDRAEPIPDIAVTVLDHAVDRGETLSPADLAEAMLPPNAARGALGSRDIIGMAATRRLAAGSIVRSSDIGRPQIVRRGEPVTITLRSGTLTITSSGRALASGAKGDLVRVVATATSRTLDGIVEGSGAVRIAAN